MVVRDGQNLLIRREDTRLWAVPGGLVEVGETLAEAAERELREEAGIAGRAVELLGRYLPTPMKQRVDGYCEATW